MEYWCKTILCCEARPATLASPITRPTAPPRSNCKPMGTEANRSVSGISGCGRCNRDHYFPIVPPHRSPDALLQLPLQRLDGARKVDKRRVPVDGNLIGSIRPILIRVGRLRLGERIMLMILLPGIRPSRQQPGNGLGNPVGDRSPVVRMHC